MYRHPSYTIFLDLVSIFIFFAKFAYRIRILFIDSHDPLRPTLDACLYKETKKKRIGRQTPK